MNWITIVLFSLILGGILFYYILKNHYVSKLTKAMANKKYDNVVSMSEQRSMQLFVGKFNCILFRIRALSCLKDQTRFKKELIDILEKNELVAENKKELLELYFHYFLLRNDGEYANKLLVYIHDFGEPSFYAYNEQAYAVMIEHKTDLIAAMDAEINSKKYNGFALGVLVYLIGLQYLYLEDKEEARTYFYNSISCFHKRSMYTSVAQKRVNDLSEELGLERPKY